jgi:hypothetical protein
MGLGRARRLGVARGPGGHARHETGRRRRAGRRARRRGRRTPRRRGLARRGATGPGRTSRLGVGRGLGGRSRYCSGRHGAAGRCASPRGRGSLRQPLRGRGCARLCRLRRGAARVSAPRDGSRQRSGRPGPAGHYLAGRGRGSVRRLGTASGGVRPGRRGRDPGGRPGVWARGLLPRQPPRGSPAQWAVERDSREAPSRSGGGRRLRRVDLLRCAGNFCPRWPWRLSRLDRLRAARWQRRALARKSCWARGRAGSLGRFRLAE